MKAETGPEPLLRHQLSALKSASQALLGRIRSESGDPEERPFEEEAERISEGLMALAGSLDAPGRIVFDETVANIEEARRLLGIDSTSTPPCER